MSDRLRGKRIAFPMANEGVEQVELTEPLEAIRAAAFAAKLVEEFGEGVREGQKSSANAN